MDMLSYVCQYNFIHKIGNGLIVYFCATFTFSNFYYMAQNVVIHLFGNVYDTHTHINTQERESFHRSLGPRLLLLFLEHSRWSIHKSFFFYYFAETGCPTIVNLGHKLFILLPQLHEFRYYRHPSVFP